MNSRSCAAGALVAAFAMLACVSFADGVKLENKWATSDYTYHDDPDHPTMVQCYADPNVGPAIAAATSDAAVRSVAGDESSMRALCAKVRPGYSTDPVAACQIAAVSAWVMENAGAPWYAFWRESREDARARWVDVLLAFAKASDDDYVACYFLDQVRWCGTANDAERVRATGANRPSPHVKEMAELVADELESR